jgi:hypothetical protein
MILFRKPTTPALTNPNPPATCPNGARFARVGRSFDPHERIVEIGLGWWRQSAHDHPKRIGAYRWQCADAREPRRLRRARRGKSKPARRLPLRLGQHAGHLAGLGRLPELQEQ